MRPLLSNPRTEHILLLFDLHCLQFMHSPVNTVSTWSPSLNSITPSPMLSTILCNCLWANPIWVYWKCNAREKKKNKRRMKQACYPDASCPNIRGNIACRKEWKNSTFRFSEIDNRCSVQRYKMIGKKESQMKVKMLFSTAVILQIAA